MNTATITREGTVYTKSVRFDKEQRELSEDEMFDLAPSIFNAAAHTSRSERFAPISTIDVLRRIAGAGFKPVGVKQSTARDPGRAPFTKHLIRLRKLDGKQRKVGDSVFEMLLRNANDGTAAFHLTAGIWRIRCMNSLVAKTSTLGEMTVRHTGDAPAEVLQASNQILDLSGKTLAFAEKWAEVDLSEPERLAFAKKAHKMRFVDKHIASPLFNRPVYGVASALKPARLLEARRSADNGTDLWTTFNVIQENIIKGGQDGEGNDSGGKPCRYTSRPVKGIDADVTMNAALWGLADELATKHGVRV